MKYFLYEEQNGDILFTKKENIRLYSNLLDNFTNKVPTFSVETSSDEEAIRHLNSFMVSKSQNK